MTSQGLSFNTVRTNNVRRADARGWTAAVAEWRRRAQTRAAFRHWMSHERALQDMGPSAADDDVSLWRQALFLPLGHFGFVSLGLGNLGLREPLKRRS